jgi:hypothetical protein
MWGSALLFVLTILGTIAAAAAAAYSLFRGYKHLAARLIVLLVAAGGVYALLLVGSALASDRVVIALGGEKHICELDCHVAYSVVGVERAESLGEGAAKVRANGVFYVVTLRTRFDGQTISSGRPADAPLVPGDRRIEVIDEAGSRYAVSTDGQKALDQPPPSLSMLTRTMRPGEEFVTRLVFDLPANAREPMLLIGDADFTKWVLIGSETFPLHRKALFRLTPGPGVRDVAS